MSISVKMFIFLYVKFIMAKRQTIEEGISYLTGSREEGGSVVVLAAIDGTFSRKMRPVNNSLGISAFRVVGYPGRFMTHEVIPIPGTGGKNIAEMTRATHIIAKR